MSVDRLEVTLIVRNISWEEEPSRAEYREVTLKFIGTPESVCQLIECQRPSESNYCYFTSAC